MKKNRARNKSSWLCFQIDCKKNPVNLDSKSRSIDPVKKSVVKQEEKLPISTISIEKKISGSTSEKGISRSGSSSSSRRKLSKIVKTVFFETILIKKSKKIKEDIYKDFSDLKSNRPTLKEKEEDGLDSRNCSKEVLSTSSSPSLSSSILSSSSSLSNLYSLSERKKSSSFRSNSLESKQILVVEESKQSKTNSNKKIKSLSSTNGLYLLVISLIVLIFWGRICAIISTSTWVYFSRNNNYDKQGEEEEEIVIKPAEQVMMESREYKKRVIMEGLLERSHSRF